MWDPPLRSGEGRLLSNCELFELAGVVGLQVAEHG
jgi:hypothetical protein